MTELEKDVACWRCEHDLTVKHIDEEHHIAGDMLQCQNENGGGATRHYKIADYCMFCGEKIDI